MQHPLVAHGLANVRDLGGLRRRDGSVTPSGVFVRSETIDRVDTAGWRMLREYGVRSVLDLRRPGEYTRGVPDDIHSVRIDLDGDERGFWDAVEADGRWGTPLYYTAHLRDLPHRLAEALNAIADAPSGAILFHCGAGWDRTGLLAAVLLRALDVTADDAAADYLASFDNSAAMEALHERTFHVDERRQVLGRFQHTAESAFRAMYAELDLPAWFAHAAVGERTRHATVTWRDTSAPCPSPPARQGRGGQ